jgi:hypothetical protein
MVKTTTVTTDFSHLISDQTRKGNLDAFVVPPVDIKGSNNQPRIRQLVQQHHHLQAPTKSKKKKSEDVLPLMWRQTDSISPQTKSSHYNSAEYCMVAATIMRLGILK